MMDEVVVRASESGWDIGAFIQRVKNDTTFYKAFKSLRVIPYSAINDIKILNKKGEVIATRLLNTVPLDLRKKGQLKIISRAPSVV